MGSNALIAAIAAYKSVKRVAFPPPYYPSANHEVRRFLEEMGYEVAQDIALEAKSRTQIGDISGETLCQKLLQLNDDSVDALIQVGTNLSMIRLAAAAEMVLAKPVSAINTAIYWHALRTVSINAKVVGFGRSDGSKNVVSCRGRGSV